MPACSARARWSPACSAGWRTCAPERGICPSGVSPTAPSSRSAAIGSEEHTSELQSLMRISYAVFCLKKKKDHNTKQYSTMNSNNRFEYRSQHYVGKNTQHHSSQK